MIKITIFKQNNIFIIKLSKGIKLKFVKILNYSKKKQKLEKFQIYFSLIMHSV